MKRPGRPERHAGVALLAGLVLMAAISLLALVATASMMLQLRMAGNFADTTRARLAADSATRSGQRFLFALADSDRLSGCRQDCFRAPLDAIIRPPNNPSPAPEYENSDWWLNWGIPAATAEDESARYLVEELYFAPMEEIRPLPDAPPIDGIAYYRVLGRASGKAPAAVAVHESIVARPWLGEETDPDITDLCRDYGPWYDCGSLEWRQRR